MDIFFLFFIFLVFHNIGPALLRVLCKVLCKLFPSHLLGLCLSLAFVGQRTVETVVMTVTVVDGQGAHCLRKDGSGVEDIFEVGALVVAAVGQRHRIDDTSFKVHEIAPHNSVNRLEFGHLVVVCSPVWANARVVWNLKRLGKVGMLTCVGKR